VLKGAIVRELSSSIQGERPMEGGKNPHRSCVQPHRLQDGSGFCGADMHPLKNIDLQKQCIGRSPVTGK